MKIKLQELGLKSKKSFFVEIDGLILRFTQNSSQLRIAKTNLKNNAWDFTLVDIEI